MNNKKIACFISYSHDEENTKKFKKINELISNSNNCINYTEKKIKVNLQMKSFEIIYMLEYQVHHALLFCSQKT